MDSRTALSCAALLLCLLAFATPVSAAPPTVTLSTPEQSFSPDGDGVEDTLGFGYRVSERSRVSITIVDAADLVVRHIQTDVPTEGSASFNWDGRRDASTAVAADGVYRYRVTATGESGERATAERRVGIDTGPVAALTAPAADAGVTGNVTVIVSPLAGRVLTGAYLYLCHSPAQCSNQSLGSVGAADIDGARQLVWNTANTATGDRYLWGYAYYHDVFGYEHAVPMATRHVVVQRPVQVTATSGDRFFSPDGDGNEDTYSIAYRTTAPGTVTIRIRDAGGAVVRRLRTDVFVGEGSTSATWDGRDDGGATVADGEYTYTVDVVGAIGPPASASGRIGVDTRPVAEIVSPGAGAAVDGIATVRVAPRSARTLTGGYMYACFSAVQCSNQSLGSLGQPDVFGARSLDWNTATLATGPKWLWGYAFYNDAYGQEHAYPLPVREVLVRRAITLSLTTPDRYFSPDGDGNEDTVTLGFTVNAPATATITITDELGQRVVRRIAYAIAVGEGSRSFSWDGRDDVGARVADGIYIYSVQVSGEVGQPWVASRRVGVDTRPVAEITSPAADTAVTGTVDVTVSPVGERTLTGAYLYACYSAVQCSNLTIGAVGAPDANGARSRAWNTGSTSTGQKWIWGYAEYQDGFGVAHSYPMAIRRVVVERPVALTLSTPERYFSPDGDGNDDTVSLGFSVTAPAAVTIRVRDEAGGLVRRIATDLAVPEGARSFSWDGRDEDGARVPDGVYRYTLDAAGSVGDPVSASSRVGVDTRPVAELTAPSEDAVITGVVRVKVAPAAGRTVTGGYLYVCYSAVQCSNQSIGALGVPDFDGSRGVSWNTASTSVGTRYVWGYAYYNDAFGVEHAHPLPVRRVVVTRAVQISNVSTDRYFTPDDDGSEDTGGPSYCIDAPADMRLVVERAGGGVVRTLRSDARPQGCSAFTWDGRDDDGAPAPAGGYTYTLIATGPEGLATTVAGRIGIRREAPGRVLRPAADDVLSRSAAFTFAPGDVAVTEVVPCITSSVCFPITAANAAGHWATALQLTPQHDGARALRVTARWRDAYGSSHETPLPPIAVTVNTAAPEPEVEATPAGGEAPVTSRVRLDARSESGRALSYTLDFGDGSAVRTGTLASPYAPLDIEHEFKTPGVYRILADVNDGAGNGARRSTLVTVTAPPNRAPSATLALDHDEGSAPFDVAATIAGEDADGDALSYRVSFGDGSPEQTGELPHTPLTHTYTTAGSFLVRLSVSDGELTTTKTARVVTALPEPLTAAAGDDQRVTTGEAVTFDAGGSRPAALITGYEWDFGDGATAVGRRVTHTYARSGTFTAKLTTRAGTDTQTDTAVITVSDAPAQTGLVVRVNSGGGSVPGASVTYVGADGSRVSAASGSDGTARLSGLPDGTHSLYVYADGFRPKTVSATVADGRGEATAELERGELGAATLTQRRMTYAEIIAAGIDVNDPANTHVYEAKIHLYFDPVGGDGGSGDPPPPGRVAHLYYWAGGLVCASNCGSTGGGADACPEADTLIGCWVINGYQYLPSLTYVAGQPFIHWLVLPMRASFLKAFFDVHLIVQNLADPGFSFAPGVAGLQLPSGLSLAPLPTPQAAVQDVGAIPGGSSRTLDWIVRGDKEGSYDLSATYSSALQPVDVPVFMTARTRTPLEVYGASALKTRIVLDCYAQRWGPYGFEVEITNVKDAPVYNLEVEMLEQEAGHAAEEADFFYATVERRQRIAELAPGATFRARYTVFAGLGLEGDLGPLELILKRSFVQRTGGDVDLDPELVKRDPCPAVPPRLGEIKTEVKRIGSVDHAVLTWDRPAPAEGDAKAVTGYQLWTRQRLETGEWTRYGEQIPSAASGRETIAIPATADALGRYYMLATEHGADDVRFEHLIGVGPSRYVSLGDSFSAGEGVPAFDPGTAGDVDGDGGNKCHRSLGSYGRLIAADDGVQANLAPMTADACSGAIAADVWMDNRSNPDEGPQEESVNQFTDVITLSMGGNDIGFKDIAIACIMPAIDCNASALSALGSQDWLRNFAHVWDDAFALASDIRDVVQWVDSCLNFANIPKKILCHYRSERLINDFDEAIHTERRVSPLNLVDNDLRTRLVQAYDRLLERAPHAQVYVMPYPKVVDGVDVAGDCELLGAGEPALTRGDRRAIASVIDMLNAEVRTAVRAAGSSRLTYVDLGDEFDAIPLCKNGKINPATGFNSATNPFFSTPGNYGPISYAFHPNAYGQQAYARALKRALDRRLVARTLVLDLGETVDVGTLQPAAGATSLQATASWPGSTVSLSLVSPSGTVVDERTPGVQSVRTPTTQRLVVSDPQPGTWTVRVTGDDVAKAGEPVKVDAFTTSPDASAPTVSARAERVGATASTFALIADGAAGATHTWALSDGAVVTGARVEHRFTNAGELWATLKTTTADGQVVWTPLTVRAADASTPTIAAVADVVAEATSGSGRAVTFPLPAATDGVGDPVVPACVPASGSTFGLGATEVTCTATAGGKAVATRFTVRVQDTTGPVFGPAPDVATPTYATPAANDAVDGAVPVTCSPASGAAFGVGATRVTCTAADRAGNASRVEFTVAIDAARGAPRPADPAPPAVGRLRLTGASVRKAVVTVQLACPAGTSGCPAVTARLVTKHGRKQTVVVATARAGVLASGKAAKVSLKLNAKGRSLLKRAKRLKATVEIRQGTAVLGKRAVTVRR